MPTSLQLKKPIITNEEAEACFYAGRQAFLDGKLSYADPYCDWSKDKVESYRSSWWGNGWFYESNGIKV